MWPSTIIVKQLQATIIIIIVIPHYHAVTDIMSIIPVTNPRLIKSEGKLEQRIE